MNKKLFIIIAAIVLFLVIGTVLYFLLGKGGSSISGVPSGGAVQGQSGDVFVPQVSTSMPADGPTGNTFVIQGATQGIVVNNFYKTATGYAANEDAILIAQRDRYSLWYYRGSGGFEVALTSAGTDIDAKSGTQELQTALGIDTKTLCSLSVSVTYPVDGGASKGVLPLSGCSTGAFSAGATN